MYLLELTQFAWLEGDRTFTVAFGTFSALACLAVAVPTLIWTLPSSRTWLFGKRADPHQIAQFCFGLFGMAMAVANALCRYIPHRPLGIVHPTFFFTTAVLLLVLTPFVTATYSNRTTFRLPMQVLTAVLALLVAAPVAAVVNAFWF